MTTLGVDYSGHPPNPTHIAAAGYTFAARYLSPPPNPKNLTVPEATALIAAGVDVVMVWEASAGAALGGSAAGADHGHRAAHLADQLGAPTGAAIYFAVDFDAQPSQFPAIRKYAAAFAAAVSPRPAGVYGGYKVIADLAVVLTFCWQTAAWSGGRRHPAADLYQRIAQVRIDGTVCDVDEASGSYGGWLTTAPTHPNPLPLPPVLSDPEELSMLVPVQLPVTDTGSGYWDCDGNPGTVGDPKAPPRPLIHWAQYRGVTVNGNDGTPDPRDDGKVRANQHGDVVRLGFSGFPPGSAALVWVQTAIPVAG